MLFGNETIPEAVFQDNLGWHLGSVLGYSAAGEHRSSAASGGLLTWCLENLLSQGMVDRVSIVRFHRTENSFFEFQEASSPEDIRSAAGSVYQPVEISSLIRRMLAEPNLRWAVVGVPCLCSAIRALPQLRNSVRYLFGLACGMYQNVMYTEMLLSKAGVAANEVAGIGFRDKSTGGRANNYGFAAWDEAGCRSVPVRYQGLPFFLGSNGYFRLDACNYCKDVFAESADACFMDAWLPECVADSRGTSLVVIRNKEVHNLFAAGVASEELCLTGAGANDVVNSQASQVRRKQELIYMRCAGSNPSKCREYKVTLLERWQWWLQRRTLRRSKASWARFGRKSGRGAFWIAVLDLLALQKATGLLMRAVSAAKSRLGGVGR